MPELPEVETVRRGAEPQLRGRRLLELELHRPDLRWPMPEAALRDLIGRRCTGIDRRSKYLLLRFDGAESPSALVHLGMTGRLLVEVCDPGRPRPEWRRHEHWRMDFGDRLVRFVDPRRFGALDVVAARDQTTHKLLAPLGQEPLEPGFDGAFLHRVSRRRRSATKTLLMDGHVLVGVGNIYASEACWRAAVRPRRAAGSLTRAECDRLAAAVREVLSAAIDAGGTSFRDYVGVHEDAGFFARELAVYERAGAPCPRCRGAIRRTTDGGRSTYWCAGCQT
ncbi:MAG: bifunctional DNA-formamidopyrimidine glycosylase/DNA-(apurinic or apyrimidinic site) lyase [Planctomycetes bacterium]|jgi:formamidopyrimidine-DNA glycosylase|nr:bifunctional DNA-formamidopyrimidine glycosylase/DNA-(apurinic or apyrimidinic site) lyase [Planctomycetota bacterium]